MFDSLQFLPRSKLGRELEIKQKDLSVVRRAEDKSLEQLAGGAGDLVRKKNDQSRCQENVHYIIYGLLVWLGS